MAGQGHLPIHTPILAGVWAPTAQSYGMARTPILRQLPVAIGFSGFWTPTPQSYGTPKGQNPTATGSCHRILPFSAFKIIQKKYRPKPGPTPNPTARPKPNPTARPKAESYGTPKSQSYGTPISQSYGTPKSQSYGTPISQSYGAAGPQSYYN